MRVSHHLGHASSISKTHASMKVHMSCEYGFYIHASMGVSNPSEYVVQRASMEVAIPCEFETQRASMDIINPCEFHRQMSCEYEHFQFMRVCKTRHASFILEKTMRVCHI